MGPQGHGPDLRVPRPPSQGPPILKGRLWPLAVGRPLGQAPPEQLGAEPLPERKAQALSCWQQVLRSPPGHPQMALKCSGPGERLLAGWRVEPGRGERGLWKALNWPLVPLLSPPADPPLPPCALCPPPHH